METIEWPGKSGTVYKYSIFPLAIGTSFHPRPGNFILCKEEEPQIFVALFVGEASDLSRRFPSIDGATHVHTHTGRADARSRQEEVRDIAARWCPIS